MKTLLVYKQETKTYQLADLLIIYKNKNKIAITLSYRFKTKLNYENIF